MAETRRLVIRLDSDIKDEAEFLSVYDKMRASRRQDWARRQLLTGFRIGAVVSDGDENQGGVKRLDSTESGGKAAVNVPASSLKGLMPV